MKFKRYAYWAFVFALTWMTVEIAVRRWAWEQVPTDIPNAIVYVVLAVNAVLIVGHISKIPFVMRPR